VKVFARLKPDDKKRIINSLKKRGVRVMMCGDGTNDISALQAG